jgi:hypothetical protein
MYGTKRHGSVKYADGGSKSITFADVGDFTFDGVTPNQREVAAIMNRGDFGAWVETDEIELSFSFSYHLKGETLTSASVERALDAIRFTGTWAAATSTNPGGFGAKVGTLTYTLAVNGTTSLIPINYASLKASANESGNAVVISVSGKGWLGTISAS